MAQTKILLVEDDETIAFGVKTYLTKAQYWVDWQATAAGAQTALANQPFDLALLDWNLPDGNGGQIGSYIKSKFGIPFIFLTVRDADTEIVQGLDMGADDYVVKPFQLAVLRSRIQAVLRRGGNSPQQLLRCDNITLEQSSTAVCCNGRTVDLTAGEYRLLLMLLLNKGQTLARSQLLAKLWDEEGAFVNDNTLTVAIKRLREKLDNPHCIQTVRGLGYRAVDTKQE